MTEYRLTHLPPAAMRLGHLFARPKIVATACVIALSALGWGAVALMAEPFGSLASLCQPLAGTPGALLLPMWCAMTLAMMLPTAGPMLLTYAEIAETAARQSERIVTPFVLAAGYATVWFCFAAVATLLQLALARAGFAATSPKLVTAALFVGAGAFQFSAFKVACLMRCQQPILVFLPQLGDDRTWRVSLGPQAGRLLPRMLLGDDDADVRRRSHERGVDGGARDRDDDREMSKSPVVPRVIGAGLTAIGFGFLILR